MGRHYQILLPLLSLFLVRVDLTDLFPLKIPVKVLKVYDGDTVLVSHGNYQFKVRLLKIDSPEKGQPYLTTNADAGLRSSRCLARLAPENSEQELWIIKKDIYGRVLGELKGISLKMIELGCATLYPHAEFASVKEKYLYLQALKKAKAQQVGLWSSGGIRQPKLWRKSNKRISRRQ